MTEAEAPSPDEPNRTLVALARRAVATCEAGSATAEVLRERIKVWRNEAAYAPPIEVVAAGKAAAAMAMTAMDQLPGARGLAVTKDDHHQGFVPAGLELRFAGHPRPDLRSEAAGRAMVARLEAAGRPRMRPAATRVVALWSGGASALLSAPRPGLSLADVQRAHDALLAAGCAIDEINAVRKQILCAAGGRLAQATRLPIEVFVVSDVLGDDPSVIGSGPFAPDDGRGLAREVVARVELPEPVRQLVLHGSDDRDGARLDHVHHHIVASIEQLLAAATTEAEAAGFRVKRLPPEGRPLDDTVARLREALDDLAPGEILITGGEPTLALPRDHGQGGRAQQLALAMAKVLHQHRGAVHSEGGPSKAGPSEAGPSEAGPSEAGHSEAGHSGARALSFLSVGSDGTDGPTPAAGAVVDATTREKLGAHGDPEQALRRCDAHPLLEAGGATITWGATGTNVLDLHLLAHARS